ncbi:CsiV family protein [Alkalimonas collagenimarina]|uniref:CsiV family protein n=1 Tax=Alkalimonas collagenimarina TaxID=400390 RepID=A0ABT9H0W7_9GAMM|nr:CsiV family protein [Alkalimonas collagenimarina]MDP4536925.1 CsiV family protein [Alkalimonas collagenimarina]
MKHNWFTGALLLFISVLASLTANLAVANVIDASRVASGDRWFEVEMIVFQRQPDTNLIEQFNPDAQLTPPARYFDLLQPLYQPDIAPLLRQLELCPEQQSANQSQSIATGQSIMTDSIGQPVDLNLYVDVFTPPVIEGFCIFEPQPSPWQHSLFADNQWIAKTPMPASLMQQPVGKSAHQPIPYLLRRDALQLDSIARQLQQQANIDVLLHSGFRQAPVTDRRSIPSRWYAGHNLRHKDPVQTNAMGPRTPASSLSLRPDHLLERIEQRYQQLSTDEPLRLYRLSSAAYQADTQQDIDENSPLWQLDGFVRVHLDHYLFINTDFILRQLAKDDEGAIHQHRIQFSRRVISGEMHYIDHPRLGMVVQIRRYQPPTAESDRSNSAQ